jgi:hypothetical protein
MNKTKALELWKNGNLRIVTFSDNVLNCYKVKEGITEQELLDHYEKYPLSFADKDHITIDQPYE